MTTTAHDPETAAKLSAFKAKCDRFQRLGYDRFAAARFVAESGAPYSGPVLDVGTGRGMFAIALAKQDLSIVSVDTDDSDRLLAQGLAKEAGVEARIRFITGDAAQLPFPEGHFGGAAMMDVLHHLPQPERVLTEMAHLVKTQGSLLLADFNEEGFALLDRINREEGKEHPRLAVSVDFAVGVLLAQGCRLRRRSAGHLHEIALLVKEG